MEEGVAAATVEERRGGEGRRVKKGEGRGTHRGRRRGRGGAPAGEKNGEGADLLGRRRR